MGDLAGCAVGWYVYHPVLRGEEVPPPLGIFVQFHVPGGGPPPSVQLKNLGHPLLVQFEMAEYCQIRDDNQNCFCGICVLGFLGKDFGNSYVSKNMHCTI